MTKYEEMKGDEWKCSAHMADFAFAMLDTMQDFTVNYDLSTEEGQIKFQQSMILYAKMYLESHVHEAMDGDAVRTSNEAFRKMLLKDGFRQFDDIRNGFEN